MTKDKNTFLLLLALAAMVLVGTTAYLLSRKDIEKVNLDNQVKKLEIQSSSTEIEAIEKDLLNTDLNNLDQELSDIEKEIEAAY